MTLLLLCSLFDLESKPDEIDEDKNRETRSERHKRVSRPRNGNNFLESSLKLAYSSRYYHRGPTEISATGRYDQIKTSYRIDRDLLANICQFNLIVVQSFTEDSVLRLKRNSPFPR